MSLRNKLESYKVIVLSRFPKETIMKNPVECDGLFIHSYKKYLLRPAVREKPSVQFSHSVMSDSLWPRGLQHARPPCPSPTPRVYSNSCPLSWWCYPTTSFSVVPFSSCLQAFPASESFQMSQFFVSGGQSIRVSASASVLPMNIQDWFPLGWTGWICLQFKGLSRIFPTPQFKSINSSIIAFELRIQWQRQQSLYHCTIMKQVS